MPSRLQAAEYVGDLSAHDWEVVEGDEGEMPEV